jgi:hypothetical protein
MINLEAVNLMGFTAETQMYFVQNAGGPMTVKVSEFLMKNKKYFDQVLHCGQHHFGLRAPRIAKFKAYCEKHGFKVTMTGRNWG